MDEGIDKYHSEMKVKLLISLYLLPYAAASCCKLVVRRDHCGVDIWRRKIYAVLLTVMHVTENTNSIFLLKNG